MGDNYNFDKAKVILNYLILHYFLNFKKEN
jgi:hypothetical protein